MAASTKKICIEDAIAALEVSMEKHNISADDRAKIVVDFKAGMNAQLKKIKQERAPRPPSQYNIFVQSKKTELMAAGFTGRSYIREAARLWKEEHGSE
jgi:hypothetical protein